MKTAKYMRLQTKSIKAMLKDAAIDQDTTDGRPEDVRNEEENLNNAARRKNTQKRKDPVTPEPEAILPDETNPADIPAANELKPAEENTLKNTRKYLVAVAIIAVIVTLIVIFKKHGTHS